MKYKSFSPILCLMLSGGLAFGAHVQAQEQTQSVTLSHVITTLTNNSDGISTVTLALTIHNQSDENLTSFRLLPMLEFGFQFPANDQALEIETIASGATIQRTWSLSSIGGLSSDSPKFDQLMFAAEAIDASQALKTFPINSLRGAP